MDNHARNRKCASIKSFGRALAKLHESEVGLSAASPRSAPGFPLQSLTHLGTQNQELQQKPFIEIHGGKIKPI